MNYEIDDNGVLTFLGSRDLFVRDADCNRVKRIVAPLATTVYCDGCTELTSLDLPSATCVLCRGCTELTPWFAPQVVELLTGGGKSLKELESSVNWDCHDWSNCPIHTAFGVDCISDVPEQFRSKAAIFVGMFDAGLLSPPWAKCG